MEIINHIFVLNEFIVNESDRCEYIKLNANFDFIIYLYVDDMLIFGTDKHVINYTKKFLSSKPDMEDLVEASVILGIKIICGIKGNFLSKPHYIEEWNIWETHCESEPVSSSYDPRWGKVKGLVCHNWNMLKL